MLQKFSQSLMKYFINSFVPMPEGINNHLESRIFLNKGMESSEFNVFNVIHLM